jgi:hypothetical protein
MPILRQERPVEDVKHPTALQKEPKMLYVHKLSDLNMRLADIESIEFIREIRAKMNLPVSPDSIYEYLSSSLVSTQDIEAAEQALDEISPVVRQLDSILLRKESLHEPVNIFRTLQMLKQVPEPLANNIIYLKEILSMQAQLINDSAPLLNSIPTLNTSEERTKANAALSGFFEKMLRNKDFYFRHLDIIYEAHTSIMDALEESMLRGYLFHVTLEEELRKADFAQIKFRIPAESLAEAEEIRQKLRTIKQGVDTAYQANMKMVTCAVLLYSCIKWVNARRGY